ncbi:MAG: hypothetical protein ACMG55_13745 [Microcoleus sp.]
MVLKPPVASYQASYPGEWVAELLIPDFLIKPALKGSKRSQDDIAMRFRTVCERDYGDKPEWVNFDQLVLIKMPNALP